MITYNISRTLLQSAFTITPGKGSPTVTALDDASSCAVSALILKKESAVKMDELEGVGAKDILLFDIANSRM